MYSDLSGESENKMKLEMIFVAVTLFAVVFIAGLNIYTEGATTYSVDTSADGVLGRVTENSNRIYELQDNMKDDLQGGTVTDEDAVDEMIKGGYTSIRNNPFSVLTAGFNATITILEEIPYVEDVWVGTFLIVMTALLIFGIIALVFRFTQR